MKTGKIKNTAVFLLCLIVAAGFIFVTPDQAEAKAKTPPKVTSFRVTSTDYDAVYLKWGAQKGIKTYKLYRSTTKGGKYKLLKTCQKNTFKDTYVRPGVTYWYKVRAVKGIFRGPFSTIVKGTPRPKTPGFSAVSRTNGAKLTAKAVRGASGYVFYRNGNAIKVQKGCVFTDPNAPAMKTAMYKVAAYRVVKGKKVFSYASKQLPAAKVTATVKLENCTKPTTIDSGSKLKNTGKIKANAPFNKVEIGIVRDNSWVRKYQVSGLNTNEFNISNANTKFTFNNLPGGTYKYRIYVHFDGGIVHTALNHAFTVKGPTIRVDLSSIKAPTAGAKGAIAWAKIIAKDNRFEYGAPASISQRSGCYFCGTNTGPNKYKKGHDKKFERTYCCNTFITAAYAHGANDPGALKICKRGSCIGMCPDEGWSDAGFKYIGKPNWSQIQNGDVLSASNSSKNHVWMVTDKEKDLYVEASGAIWGNSSISEKSGAKSTYGSVQWVYRYAGPGNGVPNALPDGAKL